MEEIIDGMKQSEQDIVYIEDEDALVTAAFYGNIDTIKHLLKIGKNIDAQNEEGDTALMEAINEEWYYQAWFLVKVGADVNICNNDKDRALDLAKYAQKRHHKLYPNLGSDYIDHLVRALELHNAKRKNGISAKEEQDDLMEIPQRPLILDFLFKDDRKFMLEICPVETRSLTSNEQPEKKWAIITRRNVPGYPPYRTDQFKTRNEALNYYKKIVVETPRVSLDNKPLTAIPSLDKYKEWLVDENLFDPILNPRIKKDV